MGGDEGSFRDFVAGQSVALLRTGWMLTGERGLAEDLLQTALAKTWPHWSRVCEGGHPAAYVRTVMVRTYAGRWSRRWRAEVPTAEPPERVVDSAALVSADDRDVLVRALARLPRRQRAVVVLRYYQDLPETEVAAMLSCSVGTVKTHASRGLARLRELAAEEHLLRVGDE